MADFWGGGKTSVIRFGPFQLDHTQGLRRGKEELRVTPKSLRVLWELASRAGQLVTKEQLFRTVWADTAVGDSALTSCIQELRQALCDNPRRPLFIETLHRRGYRFIAETLAIRHHEPPPIASDVQIIGRQGVISDILKIWSAAERGTRQVLFLSGEAGIGKTTVLQHVRARLTAGSTSRATWGQCLQHYGIGEAYQPLLEAIMRLCRQPGGAGLIPILEQYSPTWLAQLPALLDPERHASVRRSVAGTTRRRMLRELTDALEAATTETPLVLCLEDLHWSDASTLDWIAAFAQRPEPTRVLLIGTFRPQVDASDGAPLSKVIEELHIRRRCHQIPLSGMSESAVADFVARRLPPAPGHAEKVRRLAFLMHRHTGGNPLFLVNVIEDLVARDLIVDQSGRWEVSGDLDEINLGIPDDVRRIIARQLERLPPAECDLLEVASVGGGTFSAIDVAAATGLSADEVERTLTQLARQHRFVRPSGARFEFDHVLYRDALYERVPSGRRAVLHREIGEREEANRGEHAREIAAELALHFERSGDMRRTGMYLEQAAENARDRSAFAEARMHFQRALALLENEPAGSERTEREIKLLIGLGSSAMGARGWGTPEAEKAYSRARELCRELGESPALFPALWGLWLFYWGRGRLDTAQELVQDLLGSAHSNGEDAPLLQAHHAAWATAFSRGDLHNACFHAGEGIRLYDQHRHAATAATYGNHDAGVCARLFLARTLALLGRTADAVRASDDAVVLARALEHPFSLALAHVFASAVGHTCRQPDRVRIHAEAAVAIARDQDFRLLLAWASALEGWAAVVVGDQEPGLAQIANAIAEARSTGSDQFLPYLAGVAADAYLMAGRAVEGLESLDEAFRVAERTGECFWEPELLRLRGELRIMQGPPCAPGEAEQAFREAIERARSQGAVLLALRAAVSWGRLMRRAGRGREARRLMLEIFQDLDQMTGFDMDEASALVGECDPG
ncbi:MAG TPA: AAA family ATPase [Bryobacteraceae bacterium]|nr:AAA family ATPase [Bryobacteraceae bacterium]